MTTVSRAASSTELVLLVGGPDSGKSTFLVQLYGRLRHGLSTLSLVGAPESLAAVHDGLDRLSQGLPVRHTSAGVKVIQELTMRRQDGEMLRLSIPDYPGEAIDELVNTRNISPHWRDLVVRSTRWNLFIRVERMSSLPSLPEFEEPMSEATAKSRGLPLDIRLVELLQILRHERQRHMLTDAFPPDLTVVLSCWDEISDITDGVIPVMILKQRMPLFYSYVAGNWEPSRHHVMGLSAQGRTLADDKPDPEFVDHGPESMGYLIRSNGSKTGDLSELLTL
ncbi:MAG: hypothetical protein OXI96_06415 [Acidimicrobiaceae bacterium]|nr:hypothetical protein [Acidimicrobiaceae bacterium]